MRDGHTPTESIIDETHAVAEEARRRRRVALMAPVTGYRHMGRRNKRELRDLRIVLGPGLTEQREQAQARRRKIRGERVVDMSAAVQARFDDLDIPKGYLRDAPRIPDALLDVQEPKRMRR